MVEVLNLADQVRRCQIVTCYIKYLQEMGYSK
jgi:hypothetical protein